MTAFYVQVLETRRRFLRDEIAKVGRWDQAFAALADELVAVELKIEAIADDARRNGERL